MSPTFTIWMLLLVASGAMADPKNLFEDCVTATDTCVHPEKDLHCDTIASKCLIKAGQPCETGYALMCVAGAKCVSGTCACGDAYDATADKTCTAKSDKTDKWSTPCTNGDTTSCDGVNLVCPSAVCICDTNKAVNVDTGDCTEELTLDHVGYACSSGTCGTDLNCDDNKCACKDGFITGAARTCVAVAEAGQVGFGCSGDSDCGDQSMECTSDLCACATDYFGFAGTACTPTFNTVGGGCSAGDTDSCSDTNAECKEKKCQCKTGYEADGTTCRVKDKLVDGACDADTKRCEDPNAKCETNTCQCKTGYVKTDDLKCAIEDNKVGGTCTNNPADEVNTPGACTDNALCSSSSVCFCKEGYTKTDELTCGVSAMLIGGSCTGDGKGDCVDANAECTGGTCSCKTDYHAEDAGTCYKDNELGGQCSGSSCLDPNAVCSTTCSCKQGYTNKAGTTTCSQIEAGTFGGSCKTDTADTQGDCKDPNAKCSATTDGVCACKDGFTGTHGGGCADKNTLGGSCTKSSTEGSDTCPEKHECSKFVGGVCQCKAPFVASGDTCKSGTMGLGASLVMILAAIYVAFKLQ